MLETMRNKLDKQGEESASNHKIESSKNWKQVTTTNLCLNCPDEMQESIVKMSRFRSKSMSFLTHDKRRRSLEINNLHNGLQDEIAYLSSKEEKWKTNLMIPKLPSKRVQNIYKKN